MRLLLGVTGGIAAYKAADLVSKAVKGGFEVRVVMTANATRFVTPLTFEALSGHPVLFDLWNDGTGAGPSPIAHIAWAKWAEVACVAPLTASTLARLAHGLADDALSTVWLALPAQVPSLLCPAMNTEMWNNPAVQRNAAFLAADGRHTLLPPVEKRLACGDIGPGALPEVDDILAALQALHRPQSTGE